MSNDLAESSYDLSDASRIAARLAGEVQKPRPVSPAAGASSYVRFTATRLRYGARDAESTSGGLGNQISLSEPVPWSNEMMGSVGWAKMLDWCIDALDADGALIVDGRGLVIACCGGLPQAELEEMGARLLVALEHADLMSRSHGSALSMSVELESGWLVGLRVPIGDGERLVVGIITASPLSDGARREIGAAFTKKALGV